MVAGFLCRKGKDEYPSRTMKDESEFSLLFQWLGKTRKKNRVLFARVEQSPLALTIQLQESQF